MATILIVEDDIFTRDIAEMMIHDWGHETLSAGDLDEALFTDTYLKKEGLGGCDLARQAIALRPESRVLYTTGNAPTTEMKALFVDGQHFLPKPYTSDQLHDSVLDMLAT